MTTANLRDLAYEARKSCNWEEAAKLYDQAADSYPTTGFSCSKLAQTDVHNLRNLAKQCRSISQVA